MWQRAGLALMPKNFGKKIYIHSVQPQPYAAAVPWRPPTPLSTLRAPRPAVQWKQPAPPALTSATAPPPWPRAAMRAALRSHCSTAPAPEVDCAAAPAHGERLHAAAQQEPAVEKLQTKNTSSKHNGAR